MILLIALGLIWGSGYTIARYAVTNGVTPLGYTFWQCLGPAIILTLLSGAQKTKPTLSLNHIYFFVICGLIGIALPNTNMYFAAAHLPAGMLALLVNTVPILIYPLALISKQEKFDMVRFLAICLAIIGVLTLVIPKTSLPDKHAAIWVLIALLTPLCFAIFATYVNPKRPSDCSSLTVAAGMMCAATFILMPLVFATHNFFAIHFPLTLPMYIILLEIVLSSLGYVLFLWLLKIAGPVYYSLVDGVVAATGIMWGIVIFNEQFNLWRGIAFILIFSAILLMTMRQRVLAN
jgi:drug/metabolite transporter (DMT)-like permease